MNLISSLCRHAAYALLEVPILGFKVEAVQGKQVSLEWAETSGGLWERWHDPGVPLAFPVEFTSS